MNLFDKKGALMYILKVASAKNISQAKLIDRIYDYSHFNRMCNGKEPIKLEVLVFCAKKLSIDLNKLLEFSYSIEKINISELKEEFQWLMLKHDYSKLKEFYFYLNQIQLVENEGKQFKKRVEGIVFGELNGNYEKALSCFKDALAITVKNKDFINIEFGRLSNEEIRIISDIAICQNALDSTDGILLMENLIKSMEKNNDTKKCIDYYFNISYMYSGIKDYKKKYEYATKGISLALKYNDFINLGYLYYSRFVANICLECPDAALKDLDNSFYIMKLQNRTDYLKKVLSEDTVTYNIKLDISRYL